MPELSWFERRQLAAARPLREPQPEQPPQQGQLATITGRYGTMAGIQPNDLASVAYHEGTYFDSIQLGNDSKTVEKNSVLLIPGLLSEAECTQLVEDAERYHASSNMHAWKRKHRIHISQLSSSSAALVEAVLRERLLPFISRELPGVEDYIWACSQGLPVEPDSNLAPLLTRRRDTGTALASLPYRFSPEEPAINRYAAGGCFEQHTDKHALTVNILLRGKGAFEGGGTAFWREDIARARPKKAGLYRRRPYTFAGTVQHAPTLVVHANAGVGVVFSGIVKHAGRAVQAGLRHLLVASFSITDVPPAVCDTPVGVSQTAIGRA